MLRIKVWHMQNAMFETGALYFLSEFLGVLFRGGEYVSASGYGPGGVHIRGGSKSAVAPGSWLRARENGAGSGFE